MISARIAFVQSIINLLENWFFYPKLAKFYRTKKFDNSPVIIDVGANKGQSIDFFLALYPTAHIYAFEPNKRLYKKLTERYMNQRKVKLFNVGVSNKTGLMRFYENVMDETSSFAKVNTSSMYLKKKALILGRPLDAMIKEEYDVHVTTLTEFFVSQNIEHVNILKIDVEGHEKECIEGLTLSDHPLIEIIQLEQHHNDMYIDNQSRNQIESMLRSNNFHESKRLRHAFGNFDEIIYVK